MRATPRPAFGGATPLAIARVCSLSISDGDFRTGLFRDGSEVWWVWGRGWTGWKESLGNGRGRGHVGGGESCTGFFSLCSGIGQGRVVYSPVSHLAGFFSGEFLLASKRGHLGFQGFPISHPPRRGWEIWETWETPFLCPFFPDLGKLGKLGKRRTCGKIIYRRWDRDCCMADAL